MLSLDKEAQLLVSHNTYFLHDSCKNFFRESNRQGYRPVLSMHSMGARVNVDEEITSCKRAFGSLFCWFSCVSI